MKSSKEKWLSKVQLVGEKGENEIGGPSTVTACLHCHRMSHNMLHCHCYTCLECHISVPGHTLGNCMGPPHSPSHIVSPTSWTLSSDEPSSPPPCYHPYHTIQGCPQGIHVKKSQGTSPHPQPRTFSPVDSLDLYDPSSCPLSQNLLFPKPL